MHARAAVDGGREFVGEKQRFHAAPFSPGNRAKSSAEGDQKKIGMIRIATMFTTLIIGLIAGPLVSL